MLGLNPSGVSRYTAKATNAAITTGTMLSLLLIPLYLEKESTISHKSRAEDKDHDVSDPASLSV